MFEITTGPIDTNCVIEKVIRANAGAVSVFVGTVRELTHGKKTLYLTYEAYEAMAVKQLAAIADEVRDKWGDVSVAITHRIGKLAITDKAVVIAVSTPHRKAAYAANEYIMERIKELVPIWKKEHWEDGSFWVGDQQEQTSYQATGKPEETHD